LSRGKDRNSDIPL